MSENETVIPLAELDRMEIICGGTCNQSITFLAKENSSFPTECPVCKQALGSGIVQKWTAWKNFLREAKEAKIQFRVKQNSSAH
jgi:hypothetical protein